MDPELTPDPAERIRAALAEASSRVAALEREHARVVEASESSNADDEHDPEGATIAFERQQIAALLTQARRSEADARVALARVESGSYGTCVRCERAIPPERLEARPTATLCVECAR